MADTTNSRPWSVPETKELRRRWLDGDLVRDIAADLGRTRNAAISRANRLGWPPHPYGHDPRHHA